MAKTVWTDTQVVNQLDSGYHLSGTNLTYGFPTDATWFPYAESTGFYALNAAQQTMATLAIRLWDDLIPVNFSLSAAGATATVKFSNTSTNIGYAHAYYPGGWSGASSIWFNSTAYGSNSGTNNLNPPTIGQWGWAAYVHETGHALGLDHPGTYNGGSPTYANDALYMQDSQQYTIMSYFGAGNTGADWVASNGVGYYAQTPMIDDIMTIQAMYGVSTTTRTGDTVYGFNSNADASVFNFAQNLHPVVAIFDSAGTDTIDLSGWNTASLINLTPGSFSNADAMTYNISIARTAWIENAVGGGGADTLIGNSLNNVLTGNAGNDTIDGGLGTDTAAFSGNLANYTIVWNAGAGGFTVTDTRTTGSTGTDTLTGVENFRFADQTVAASAYQVGGTAYSVAASDASKLEGNSGSTGFTFLVTRAGDLSQAGSVNYAVAGSGANPASASDFTGGVLPTGVVAFVAGQASATVTINVNGDTTGELDEGFTVTLSGATGGATIGTATANGTILTDETPPSLAIAAASASLSEGDSGSTAFTFTVTRSGDISAAGTVNYAVAGTGTNAANAADFTGGVLPSGTVNFAAGAASATITVNAAGDTTVEANETFAVTLSGATGGATIATATATGTILNNDGTFNIAADSAGKAEGSGGTTAFTFTVTRSGSAAAAATVNWAVNGGTATAADFNGGVLPGGVLSFAAGQTSATITVNVVGDTVVEGDEAFTVTLSSPTGGLVPLASDPGGYALRCQCPMCTGKALAADAPMKDGVPLAHVRAGLAGRQPAQAASIGTGSATSTIQNDDAQISLTTPSVSLAEGNSGTTVLSFTVTRTGLTTGTASVNWAVSGAGVNAADFAGGALPVGTVNFAAGQTAATISVNVAGDTVVEGDEAFTVTLSGATGATIGTASATGTIGNDDASLAITTGTASVAEGNAGTTPYVFTVTRTGDLTGAASANWAVSGAVDAADFGGTLPSGTVNFAAGAATATITLNVSGDTTVEANEAFTVTLSGATGASLGTANAGGTITNDDTVSADPPVISLGTASVSQVEGNAGGTGFIYTVTRSGDLTQASSVNWAVTGSGGSAANAADFGGTLPSGTVNFASGAATATITVNVAGDTAVEASEGFTVTLSGATGATIGTASATGTIGNDDASLAIATATASLAEGNSGITPYVFTVTRTGDLSGAASANWAISGAVDAADFGGTLPSGTVNFAAGAATATVTLNVSGDTVVEADEAFTVTLSGATGATIGTATAGGTIIGDDVQTSFIGSTGNDVLDKSAMTQNLTFDLSQGGNDSATGGSGADSFAMGGTFTAADTINGGAGTDSVALAGNYGTTLTLGAASLTNVEQLVLAAGNTYSLATNDGNVAAGATLTVDASALASVNAATVNGAAETNGTFSFLGGAGADSFTGGAGADIFRGGAGADVMNGNGGADRFVYTGAADSPFTLVAGVVTTAGDDLFSGFAAGTDKIDVSAFGFTGAAATVFTAATNGFTTTGGAGFFKNSGVAVEYARRGTTARVYVDVNKDNNLGSGDLLIQVNGVAKNAITASSITF